MAQALTAQAPQNLEVELQEPEFERVGDTRTIHVDVRVIAATNVDLQDEITAGRFREDLFYRLNVIPLYLPALRERGDDISALVNFFVWRYAQANRIPAASIQPDALRFLQDYDWPGNVRELKNLVQRLLILGSGPEVELDEAEMAIEMYRARCRKNDESSDYIEER